MADARPRTVPVAHLDGLPAGLANQQVREAVVMPVTAPGQEQPIGILIAGASPARKLDVEYTTFFELVASQVGMAVQNARAAEEERRRAEMLAEIDRAKTLFFSNVSHEFRTPLTLMLGPIEDALADRESASPEAQQERLRLIQRNALRLQKLVNTLLDFSRIEAGRAKAAFVATDLAALTIDLASSFRSAVEAAGIRLIVDCPALRCPVYVDVTMWEKIVLNLMSNALKFTFEGSIRVCLREAEDHVAFSVSDTGVGIAQNELPRVFERFHRIEGTRARTHEGSGIGLALVHDLVGLHGGEIGVESQFGAGTTFSIALPKGSAHLPPEQVDASTATVGAVDASGIVAAYIAEAERWLPAAEKGAYADAEQSPADSPATSGAASMPAALPGHALRILVADDNADMRDYVSRLLRGLGTVHAVSNGQEALEAIRRQVPDIVISDVMMPVLDGFGLLSALRADKASRELPFVLLSARAGEEARIEGLQAGADDYLVKPFSGRELTARIESLLLRARIRMIENHHTKRMQDIFAQAPVAIAVLRGPMHVFEFANPPYMQIIGNRDIIGKPVRDALPENAEQEIFDTLDQVYRSGKPHVGRSVRVELARGENGGLEECFFDYVFQPMTDAHGAPEGIAAVCFEVTELTRARRSAEVANRAKDEFLAMLGHELRNPLAPIMTALQLMHLRGVHSAEKERMIIERQARHLVQLVDDLLDVSRVAQGKIALRKERVEIASVIAKSIETASPLLEERRHNLSVDVPPAGLLVDADSSRLTQVISNLLTNAAKYTEAGGRIHVHAARQQGEIVIEVRDTGIGIAPDMLPHVFDMFTQEQQALDRSHGGLGLGLAIVRSLTALHGGTASARSDGVGKGSTFVIRIPAVEAAPPTQEQAPYDDGLVRRTHRNGLAILLVDDNQDAAQLLADSLALHGHAVRIAFDGPSALRTVGSFRPAIALLDIGLPGMDGYELAVRLRQQPGLEDMRLVALTGYGQENDRQRSVGAGFDRHIVKPVDYEQLERHLRELAGTVHASIQSPLA
jgi:signal transduction histidine kinase/DNA-binding response OmpR family regulator